MASTIERLARTDAGLAAALRLSLARLTRRLRSERDPENELSIGQLSVLGALSRGGACSIGELATQEKVQPPSMTRVIAALEDHGMASRQPHPTDGRQAIVTVTDKGLRYLAAEAAARERWLDQRLAELTDDERALLFRAVEVIDRMAEG